MITGATAILASWVTGRGSSRVALHQAQTAAADRQFLPALHTVRLEGPDAVWAAAAQVQSTSTSTFKLLDDALHTSAVEDELDHSIIAFWNAVDGLAETARTALHP
ncbi:hypothetical protein ABT144_24245 [Streptomyces sp. NPDC002039]|uniref:hypothetical protein n=1 Tax=Streptomyces sp. NPDC002039 TaxID=3154660 RepID=UPI00331B4ECE